MQISSAILLSVLLCLIAPLHGETLASVLTAHNVPLVELPRKDRHQPITSFAVSSNNDPFLLAYYDDDGSGTLPPVLHVLRYDLRTKHLLRTDLHGSSTTFHGFDNVMTGPPNQTCFGSALNIYEKNHLIVIDTHINPSAGCILVLTPGLQFSAALWGFTLGQIGDDILCEENTVHFAPIHAARVAIYNARLKQRTLLYPAPADPAREQFSMQLKKHLPAREFCMQHNLPCNPADFSTAIQHVTINEPDRSFTFEARMTSENFGPQAEQSVPPQTVSYKFRLENQEWTRDTGHPIHPSMH